MVNDVFIHSDFHEHARGATEIGGGGKWSEVLGRVRVIVEGLRLSMANLAVCAVDVGASYVISALAADSMHSYFSNDSMPGILSILFDVRYGSLCSSLRQHRHQFCIPFCIVRTLFSFYVALNVPAHVSGTAGVAACFLLASKDSFPHSAVIPQVTSLLYLVLIFPS